MPNSFNSVVPTATSVASTSFFSQTAAATSSGLGGGNLRGVQEKHIGHIIGELMRRFWKGSFRSNGKRSLNGPDNDGVRNPPAPPSASATTTSSQTASASASPTASATTTSNQTASASASPTASATTTSNQTASSSASATSSQNSAPPASNFPQASSSVSAPTIPATSTPMASATASSAPQVPTNYSEYLVDILNNCPLREGGDFKDLINKEDGDYKTLEGSGLGQDDIKTFINGNDFKKFIESDEVKEFFEQESEWKKITDLFKDDENLNKVIEEDLDKIEDAVANFVSDQFCKISGRETNKDNEIITIAGITGGACAAIAIIAAAVCCCCHQKKNEQTPSTSITVSSFGANFSQSARTGVGRV